MEIASLIINIVSSAIGAACLFLLVRNELPSRTLKKELEIADMGITLAEQMSRHRKKELGTPLDGFTKARVATEFVASAAKISEQKARKLIEIQLSKAQKK